MNHCGYAKFGLIYVEMLGCAHDYAMFLKLARL